MEHYMTEAEQIVGFLQKNKPKAYCDDCITEELGLKRRQRAERVTLPLGLTSDFERAKGVCSVCQNDLPKYVTRALRAKIGSAGA
jgi:hypothetical protein